MTKKNYTAIGNVLKEIFTNKQLYFSTIQKRVLIDKISDVFAEDSSSFNYFKFKMFVLGKEK